MIRRNDITNSAWDDKIIQDLRSDNWDTNPCRDIDTVFHLAGKAHAISELDQDKDEYFRVNLEGTRKLLEASKSAGVKNFIFFSSVKASGEGTEKIQDESFESPPLTPYGQSKLEAEQLVLNGEYVPHPVVIRPVMIYGQTSKGNLPRMIEAVAKGIFPPIPEVNNKRSMVHVEDVVRAAILSAEKNEAAGNKYIVTDEYFYSTRQIYELICKALSKPVPGFNIPLSALKIMALIGDAIGKIRGKRFLFDSSALHKLIDSAWYSSEKIKKELGYKPEHKLENEIYNIVKYLGLKNAE